MKDPANSHVSGITAVSPLCENVTYFFVLTVQECYDCYYLNSFISDTVFAYKAGNSGGNPCCTTPVNLTGKGTDKYYMTLSFDDTVNNHYLNFNPGNDCYYEYWYGGFYADVDGWTADEAYLSGFGNIGITPDGLDPDSYYYVDVIRSAVGKAYPYEMRFTLAGIMTYKWTLTAINKGDVYLDFVGTGSYVAYGYGFIALDCSLLTGTVTFTEKVVTTACCDDIDWYDSWYAPGFKNYYGDGYAHGIIWNDDSPLNTPTSLTWHNQKDDYIWSWNRCFFDY